MIEHLAVLKLRNDMKSPIICLTGPQVGKTSIDFYEKVENMCVFHWVVA
jgi:hypothetical protein